MIASHCKQWLGLLLLAYPTWMLGHWQLQMGSWRRMWKIPSSHALLLGLQAIVIVASLGRRDHATSVKKHWAHSHCFQEQMTTNNCDKKTTLLMRTHEWLIASSFLSGWIDICANQFRWGLWLSTVYMGKDTINGNEMSYIFQTKGNTFDVLFSAWEYSLSAWRRLFSCTWT